MATPTQTGNMVNTFNYLVPTSGTTHVYASIIQLSANPFVGNFQALQFSGTQFRPQAAWFDNSQGTSQMVFLIPEIGFQLNIAAGANIAYNFPSVTGMTYSVTGAGQATIFFADFPLLPSSASVTLPNTTNVDIVSSITLQANIVNAITSPVYVETVPTPTLNYNTTITGTATTASVTPTANSNLRKLKLGITSNATLATAGDLTVTVQCNGVTVFVGLLYLGTTALTQYGNIWDEDIEFDDITFPVASGTVTVTLSVALATGTLNANIYTA